VTSAFPPGLFLITDRRRAAHPLPDLCRAAIGAGFAAVMLREKDLGGRELMDLAEALAVACREGGAAFVVNDRLDVALVVPGAGAHVGIRGIPVPEARRLLGPERLLGYSAHAGAEARDALEAGADYVTLSPVFPSTSKPALVPRGTQWLREETAGLPANRVIALGGMTPEGVAEVGGLGMGAAVMGDLMTAADAATRAAAFTAAWRTAVGSRT